MANLFVLTAARITAPIAALKNANDLVALASAYGVATEFWDQAGAHQVVSEETVVAVLAALGVDDHRPGSGANPDHVVVEAPTAREFDVSKAQLHPRTVVENSFRMLDPIHGSSPPG